MPYLKGDSPRAVSVSAFKEELQRLGWTEGKNVHFDERWAGDNMDLVRSNAASLVASKPDLLMAVGGRVIPILMQMTATIPILVPASGDPVASGYVKNMARPGGNVTGFAFFEASIISKMLEILKEIAPATRRVAILYNPDNPNTVGYRRVFNESVGKIAVEPIDLPIHNLGDIENALASLTNRPNAGLFFPPDVTILSLRREVVALSARHRLPAIYSDAQYVEQGGLVSYGTDSKELFRQAAAYADRILRGEKPGNLPFQLPTKFELVVNLKTAKTLGLKIPQSILVHADGVRE